MDTDTTGRGRTHGVINVLQRGGAGNNTVMVGDVGTFRGNGEKCGRDTHWVPSEDHKEASVEVRRQDMGNTSVGRRTGGSRNAVGDDLKRETAGNRGKVGGATSTI